MYNIIILPILIYNYLSVVLYFICKYYQLHINYFAQCILDSLNS